MTHFPYHTLAWNYRQSYATLPEKLYAPATPASSIQPKVAVFNNELASSLGLDFSEAQPEFIAHLLSGNQLPSFIQPIAQAYAGHQFGHFTILGDGRAILLGEHVLPNGESVDIQLKGSGATPYSRRGDGKATLKSMLREYLISEAMYHLGIPTTRSLAVVKTGDEVYRDYVHEGAVLTRIAKSHIRVGTFEFAVRYLRPDEFKTFVDYVISRHYPELKESAQPYHELLKSVIHRQAELITHWMRVGFIHGVMNTDNMSISGETIDYGPCAFMNSYNPATVFSSIDTHGRYAFGNQPNIAHWNLSVFAGTLVPLLNKNQDSAIEAAQQIINQFPAIFQTKWQNMMRNKLGITHPHESDITLIHSLLDWMQENHADYTQTFLHLAGKEIPDRERYQSESFNNWLSQWKLKTYQNNTLSKESLELMSATNPDYIPRNHLVEKILELAEQDNFSEWDDFLHFLSTPYHNTPISHYYTFVPPNADSRYKTFCGT